MKRVSGSPERRTMFARFSTVTVAVLLFLCGSANLWADMAPVCNVGYTLLPVSDNSVRMVSEKVDITLDDSLAFVSCRFDLKNDGAPKKLLTGFPDSNETIVNFRAWVGGKEIPVTSIPPVMKERNSYAITKAFTVPFGSPEKMLTVTTRYHSRLISQGSSGRDAFEDLGFCYILETGAFWKDIISEAVVTVNFGSLPPGRIGRISPEGYKRKGNTVTWRFVNFEPWHTDNIVVFLMRKVIYERMMELTKHPDAARIHYILGTVYFNHWTSDKDTRRDNAEREFLKAVELDPGMLDARYFLAVIYLLRTGQGVRPYSAIDQLREIIRRNPDYECRDAVFPAFALRRVRIPDTRASTLLSACEQRAGIFRW